MPVNRDKKILFIHNPKTAGSSMRDFLGTGNVTNKADKILLYGREEKKHRRMMYTIPLQHLTPKQIFDGGYMKREEYDGYFSFVFVRNPWDKIISSYVSYFYQLQPDFNKFLEWIKKIVEWEREHDGFYVFQDLTVNGKVKYTVNTHFREQHNYVYIDGRRAVNFIGKYENFENDFNFICKANNLENSIGKTNVTRNKKHYSAYYNDEQRKFIEELYARDIELFDYKFEEE